MSNKLVSMQIVRTIIQHLQKGFSQRRIARELMFIDKAITISTEFNISYILLHPAPS